MFNKGDVVEAVDDVRWAGLKKGDRHTVVESICSGVLVGGKTWLSNERFKLLKEGTMQAITLNGVVYKVENIPGKGDCLVPVKRTPKTGELWQGPKGGVYIVTAFDEGQGYELRSNNVFSIPTTATFYADNVGAAIKKGLIV